ncbi:MAG TPA: EAL domain-containing protein [Solirubrobacteraceae bacterium]|jgi:diguanylate cyclase (GGDEF)-like protein|nr:EAL domain-containing protein [Solirubrobacteraceae bacterium]
MSLLRACKRLPGRLSLTQRVALMSLVPMVVLGLVLTRVIEHQVEAHSVADASQSARLIANIGIQPRLSPHELRAGLTAAEIRELDRQLRARSTTENLARIKIWNAAHVVVYSDDHRLIGHSFSAAHDLDDALAGRSNNADVITPRPGSETASEVGLGQLVEVYVPLRFAASGRPAGAFEIYLSYGPIAAAIAHDKRLIVLVVAIGLAVLWAILFRIVAQASRRLRRQSRQNYTLARYDPLTGLPNRTLFRERVDTALHGAGARRDAVAVLLIDLDGFTEINGTLGNPTGDAVLCATAQRLRAQLGKDTLVARIGGDEYAILCPRADGVSGALITAENIQTAMEAPLIVGGIALNVDASIGLAVLDDDEESLDDLLQHADAALARARMQRSRVEVYSAHFDNFDPGRLLLLGEVRSALERDEFELHYQPKVELSDNRVSGVEALLRWRHPQHGLLAPMTFIPLVEQTALIESVTQRVLERAVEQMARWREQGVELEMSVNLSARNLLEVALPDRIETLLRNRGISPERLTVEVTESAAMADPDRGVEVLCALSERGIRVSIDDFGTGNASIAYLARLPADEIKIDKAFITGLCEDERAEAIARSTIDLARHLHLRVVAEGIETQAVFEHLAQLSCDTGQGYFISRPLAADALTAWLQGNGGIVRPPPSPPTAVARALASPDAGESARRARGRAAARHRSSAR